MHYIQNSWFMVNWLWIFLLVSCVGMLVAYMNNRTSLFRKSLLSGGLILTLIMFSAIWSSQYKMPTPAVVNASKNSQEVINDNPSPSIVSGIANYIVKLVRKRINP